MNYEEIQWDVKRPVARAFTSDWSKARVTRIEPLDSRLVAVVEAIDSTHVNGGAEAAQFRLDTTGAAFWFLSRNRLDEIDFFKLFFSHPCVSQAFPMVETPNSSVSDFKMRGSFKAFGELSQVILCGGAYKSLVGRDADVLRLASEFAQGAFGGRFSTTAAWVNWTAWSSYFCGIAWDGTFLFFDKTEGVITVLMFTDTD